MNLVYFLAIAAALASLGDAISLKTETWTGEEVEKDSKDPKYKKMARESFDKWLDEHKRLFDVDHIDVKKVTEQLVAGILTRLDFIVFGTTSGDLMGCHSEVWDKVWMNFRDINVDCTPIVSTKRSIQQQRFGSIDDKSPKKGIKKVAVPEEKDPSDPKYRKLASQSFDKWLDENNKLFDIQLVDVKKVTEQLVAGTMTRLDFIVFGTSGELMGCHSEVWDKVWMNFRDITVVNCFTLKINDDDIKRQRPGGIEDKNPNKEPMPGGEVEKDHNDPKYRKLARDSFDKWLNEHKRLMDVKLIDVKKVTEQVVAGIMTRLDFIVFGTSGELMGCHSKVWEQVWMNFQHITVDCVDLIINDYNHMKQRSGGIEDKSPNKEPMPGEEVEKDTKDPKYRKMARDSFDKWLDEHTKLMDVELIDVKKVTEQVVEGILTRLDFIVFGTSGELMGCHSEVWERAWLNFRDIKVYCLNTQNIDYDQIKQRSGSIEDKSPNKEPMPGEEVEKDTKDPKYRKMARDSFDKWLDEHTTLMDVELIDVKKVTEQVVEGILTRLDFIVFGTSGELMGCHSEVWERAWLNFRDIKVDCLNTKIIDYDQIKQRSGGIEDKSPNKEPMPGEEVEKDTKDPMYRKMARDSFDKWLDEHTTLMDVELIDVKKVTEQVVEGILTRLDFIVFGTSGELMGCHSEVWERGWLNFRDIKVDCLNTKIIDYDQIKQRSGGIEDKSPNKGTTDGEEEKQDPSDPKNRELALASLKKYLEKSGRKFVVEFLEVYEVVKTRNGLRIVKRLRFVAHAIEGEILVCDSVVIYGTEIEYVVNCHDDDILTKQQKLNRVTVDK